MIISLKVKPNSRQNSIQREGEHLAVRIHAPAHEGEANLAVIEFLSETFRVPKSALSIVSGHTSRFKRVTVADVYAEKVAAKLKVL